MSAKVEDNQPSLTLWRIIMILILLFASVVLALVALRAIAQDHIA
jgi:hypothetical protein